MDEATTLEGIFCDNPPQAQPSKSLTEGLLHSAVTGVVAVGLLKSLSPTTESQCIQAKGSFEQKYGAGITSELACNTMVLDSSPASMREEPEEITKPLINDLNSRESLDCVKIANESSVDKSETENQCFESSLTNTEAFTSNDKQSKYGTSQSSGSISTRVETPGSINIQDSPELSASGATEEEQSFSISSSPSHLLRSTEEHQEEVSSVRASEVEPSLTRITSTAESTQDKSESSGVSKNVSMPSLPMTTALLGSTLAGLAVGMIQEIPSDSRQTSASHAPQSASISQRSCFEYAEDIDLIKSKDLTMQISSSEQEKTAACMHLSVGSKEVYEQDFATSSDTHYEHENVKSWDSSTLTESSEISVEQGSSKECSHSSMQQDSLFHDSTQTGDLLSAAFAGIKKVFQRNASSDKKKDTSEAKCTQPVLLDRKSVSPKHKPIALEIQEVKAISSSTEISDNATTSAENKTDNSVTVQFLFNSESESTKIPEQESNRSGVPAPEKSISIKSSSSFPTMPSSKPSLQLFSHRTQRSNVNESGVESQQSSLSEGLIFSTMAGLKLALGHTIASDLAAVSSTVVHDNEGNENVSIEDLEEQNTSFSSSAATVENDCQISDRDTVVTQSQGKLKHENIISESDSKNVSFSSSKSATGQLLNSGTATGHHLADSHWLSRQATREDNFTESCSISTISEPSIRLSGAYFSEEKTKFDPYSVDSTKESVAAVTIEIVYCSETDQRKKSGVTFKTATDYSLELMDAEKANNNGALKTSQISSPADSAEDLLSTTESYGRYLPSSKNYSEDVQKSGNVEMSRTEHTQDVGWDIEAHSQVQVSIANYNVPEGSDIDSFNNASVEFSHDFSENHHELDTASSLNNTESSACNSGLNLHSSYRVQAPNEGELEDAHNSGNTRSVEEEAQFYDYNKKFTKEKMKIIEDSITEEDITFPATDTMFPEGDLKFSEEAKDVKFIEDDVRFSKDDEEKLNECCVKLSEDVNLTDDDMKLTTAEEKFTEDKVQFTKDDVELTEDFIKQDEFTKEYDVKVIENDESCNGNDDMKFSEDDIKFSDHDIKLSGGVQFNEDSVMFEDGTEDGTQFTKESKFIEIEAKIIKDNTEFIEDDMEFSQDTMNENFSDFEITEDNVMVSEDNVIINKNDGAIIKKSAVIMEDDAKITKDETETTKDNIENIEDDADITKYDVKVIKNDAEITGDDSESTQNDIKITEDDVEVIKDVKIIQDKMEMAKENAEITENVVTKDNLVTKDVMVTEDLIMVTEDNAVEITEDDVEINQNYAKKLENNLQINKDDIQTIEDNVEITGYDIQINKDVGLIQDEMEIIRDNVKITEGNIEVTNDEEQIIKDKEEIIKNDVKMTIKDVDITKDIVEIIEDNVQLSQDDEKIIEDSTEINEENIEITNDGAEVIKTDADNDVTEVDVKVTKDFAQMNEDDVEITDDHAQITSEIIQNDMEITKDNLKITTCIGNIDIIQDGTNITDNNVIPEDSINNTGDNLQIIKCSVYIIGENVQTTDCEMMISQDSVDISEDGVNNNENKPSITKDDTEILKNVAEITTNDVAEDDVEVLEEVEIAEDGVVITEDGVVITEDGVVITEDGVDITKHDAEINTDDVESIENNVLVKDDVQIIGDNAETTGLKDVESIPDEMEITNDPTITEVNDPVIKDAAEISNIEDDFTKDNIKIIEDDVHGMKITEDDVIIIQNIAEMNQDAVRINDADVKINREYVKFNEDDVKFNKDDVSINEAGVEINRDDSDVTQNYAEGTKNDVIENDVVKITMDFELMEDHATISKDDVCMIEKDVDAMEITKGNLKVIEEDAITDDMKIIKDNAHVSKDDIEILEDITEITEDNIDITKYVKAVEEDTEIYQDNVEIKDVDINQDDANITKSDVEITRDDVEFIKKTGNISGKDPGSSQNIFPLQKLAGLEDDKSRAVSFSSEKSCPHKDLGMALNPAEKSEDNELSLNTDTVELLDLQSPFNYTRFSPPPAGEARERHGYGKVNDNVIEETFVDHDADNDGGSPNLAEGQEHDDVSRDLYSRHEYDKQSDGEEIISCSKVPLDSNDQRKSKHSIVDSPSITESKTKLTKQPSKKKCNMHHFILGVSILSVVLISFHLVTTVGLHSVLFSNIRERQNQLKANISKSGINKTSNSNRTNSSDTYNKTYFLNQILWEYKPFTLPGESFYFPAISCRYLKYQYPTMPSGFYWLLLDPTTPPVRRFCDMWLICGNVIGGWMRVGHLDTNDVTFTCPTGQKPRENTLSEYDPSVPSDCFLETFRTCVIDSDQDNSCSTTSYSIELSYDKVCGRVIGYQYGNLTGFHDLSSNSSYVDPFTNQFYVDGISITHGNPRQHIWTFAAASNENKCPCGHSNASRVSPPPFVGDNYFCDSAVESGPPQARIYPGDPLWDGVGCNQTPNGCCLFSRHSYFYREIANKTSDYITVTMCREHNSSQADLGIQILDLLVQ